MIELDAFDRGTRAARCPRCAALLAPQRALERFLGSGWLPGASGSYRALARVQEGHKGNGPWGRRAMRARNPLLTSGTPARSPRLGSKGHGIGRRIGLPEAHRATGRNFDHGLLTVQSWQSAR